MHGSLQALTCLLLFVPSSSAQEKPAEATPASSPTPMEQAQPSSRPRLKIGVALEGGGALGLAHIGVLQWFEDHHIPIDYLAGTSMGGLVGGLYATGKSPQQLQHIVDAQDWDVILGGSIPFEDLSFRRKEDLVAFPNSILLGLRKGLVLPGGLNAGQQISLLIDRETLAYSNVQSFDDLPIPFRCVATDLVTGKQAVFKDGSLSQAMRATMAIPGLFSPIRESEHVYVDGGLVGNLPDRRGARDGRRRCDRRASANLSRRGREDSIAVLHPGSLDRRCGSGKRDPRTGRSRPGGERRIAGFQLAGLRRNRKRSSIEGPRPPPKNRVYSMPTR